MTTMTDRQRIAAHYDHAADREYQRLTQSPLHQSEGLLTLELIDTYIAPGADVIDIGAGPGRYAEYLLAARDCRVGLLDLSLASVEHFSRRIEPGLAERVLFARACCATDLVGVADESFDAALLLGPLYHLREESERLAAVQEACRVLRPGGYLFAAFLSPYPLLTRVLERDPDLLTDAPAVAQLAEGGALDLRSVSQLVEQYRCWPSQARVFMEGAGLRTVRLRNLEGVGALAEAVQRSVLTSPERQQGWFDLLRATCENPDLLGATIHFLYVGQRL